MDEVLALARAVHALEPAPLESTDREAIGSHVARVLDALGVEFGPTHAEIVLTEEGPKIIETHLQVGGDDIFNLVKDAVGVDMLDFQTRQTFGEKVLPDIRAILESDREPRCEAIRYTAPKAHGTFVGPADAEAVTRNPDIAVLPTPGSALTGHGSFARIARARASAPTAAAALERARSTVNALSFLFTVPSDEPGTV
ncbi:hypothetical protein [Streptomyces globisporus]|uniref:hypothetical protein n=1 Tax=Streptomyces globisporus TaxID=1908 RepID=UPI00379AE518